jgi:acyl transferase domain-containing protein
MVALGVGVQKAKLLMINVFGHEGVDSGLWIAGINSPKTVTIAGQHELIGLIVDVAADPADKVFAAKLRVSCAFHTRPTLRGNLRAFWHRSQQGRAGTQRTFRFSYSVQPS